MPKKTESDGLESHTMGPKLDIEDHEEVSGKKFKYKVLVLWRYVRRNHAPDQIIGDKLDETITRNKLKGTCLLAEFEPRNVKDALDNES